MTAPMSTGSISSANVEEDDKDAVALASPYAVVDLKIARERLLSLSLTDVASVNLPKLDDIDPPSRVIRRKDLNDLFDTDPDLTGFDVDISLYVREADDTDVRVFWRDFEAIGDELPRPHMKELCAVPIGAARDWFSKARKDKKINTPFAFIRDPQWQRKKERTTTVPPGWASLQGDPRPGLTLLINIAAGGYDDVLGFTGNLKHIPEEIPTSELHAVSNGSLQDSGGDIGGESEGYQEDPWSEIGVPVRLSDHLKHVATEAETLCDALGIDQNIRTIIIRAARWHDLGKAHKVFQETMRQGLDQHDIADDVLLAKTKGKFRHSRPYFRHELASALAFLAHNGWSREADLVAYLIAAHHGKVRMNLRALPRERSPKDRANTRFARGVWEDDELPSVDLGGGEQWEGDHLTLSIMELGLDEVTQESWTERTRELLARFGPFRLAWLETLVRVADWRASAKERKGCYDDA